MTFPNPPGEKLRVRHTLVAYAQEFESTWQLLPPAHAQTHFRFEHLTHAGAPPPGHESTNPPPPICRALAVEPSVFPVAPSLSPSGTCAAQPAIDAVSNNVISIERISLPSFSRLCECASDVDVDGVVATSEGAQSFETSMPHRG
jgi:hypothetical protein